MRSYLLASCLVLCLPPLAYANEPIFADPAEVLSLSGAPNQILPADLDGDGDDDLVICGPGPVYWAENTGAGWVAQAIELESDYELGACTALDAADIDADGQIDLAYSGPVDGAFLYQREAAWAFQLFHPDHYAATAVTLVDHQRNGTIDLFVLVPDAHDVDIRLNTGTFGVWQEPSNKVTGSASGVDMAVLDTTGDGALNVVVEDYLDLETWSLRPDTTWGHTGAEVGADVYRFVVEDLDGDSDPDAALVSNDGLQWLEGREGALQDDAMTIDPSQGLVFTLADIDQDGVVGIVHADPTDGLRLFRYQGEDVWTTRVIGTVAADTPAGVAAADVDLDGDLDVLVAGTAGLYVYDNITIHARSEFARGEDLPGSYTDPDFLAAGDFDRDGDDDLIVSADNGSITVLRTQEGGVWTQSGQVNDRRLHGRGLVADFDGDGDLDVVGGSDSGVTLLENDGELPWPRHTMADASDTRIALGDLDGDGDPDVVLADGAAGELQWIDNLGWTEDFGLHTIDAGWAGLSEIALGDLDGDGDLDIAVSQDNGADYWVAWYRNGGDAESWTRHTIATREAAAPALLAADLLSDGVMRVVAQGPDGMVAYRPGDDPTASWTVEIEQLGASWGTRIEGAADFDFDSDLDWMVPADSAMVRVLNRGDQIQTSGLGDADGISAHVLLDVDDDGDQDVVAAMTGEDAVGIWVNQRGSLTVFYDGIGSQAVTRARPGTEYRTLEMWVGSFDDEEHLDIELSAIDVVGWLDGDPVDPALLAQWLDITLYLETSDRAGFDPAEDDPVGTEPEVLEDGVRLRPVDRVVEIPALVSWQAYLVTGLTAAAFEGPRQELTLEWRATGVSFDIVHPDVPVCHVQASEDPRVQSFGIGNRLLRGGSLGFEIESGGSFIIDPLAGASDPDGDTVRLVAVTAEPAHGRLTDNEDGTFTYESANDGASSDGVVFELTDGIHAVLAAATIAINVPPQAPFAFNSSVETVEDTAVVIQLGGGDQDDAFTFAIAAEPSHGELVLTDPVGGAARYTPEANYVGGDSFTFTVSGGEQTSDPATVAVMITATDLDDDDGDGVEDFLDNCRDLDNPDQADLDRDGQGDDCDSDVDGDMEPDETDLCPLLAASVHGDNDSDGVGDACDDDDDNDGVADRVDVCRWIADEDQADLDDDGLGDLCDDDVDGDGVDDDEDNCPEVENRAQWDADGDEDGDACDDDDDDDGVDDDEDVCPFEADEDQADSDGDGVGDACDGDRDSDGVPTDRDCDDDDPTVFAEQTYYSEDDTVTVCSSEPPEGYAETPPTDSGDDSTGPDAGVDVGTDSGGEGESCAVARSTRSRSGLWILLAGLAWVRRRRCGRQGRGR